MLIFFFFFLLVYIVCLYNAERPKGGAGRLEQMVEEGRGEMRCG